MAEPACSPRRPRPAVGRSPDARLLHGQEEDQRDVRPPCPRLNPSPPTPPRQLLPATLPLISPAHSPTPFNQVDLLRVAAVPRRPGHRYVRPPATPRKHPHPHPHPHHPGLIPILIPNPHPDPNLRPHRLRGAREARHDVPAEDDHRRRLGLPPRVRPACHTVGRGRGRG